MKVGDKVYDRWWPWRVGKIIKILKTRVKIEFPNIFGEKSIVTYDKAHLKFLEVIK